MGAHLIRRAYQRAYSMKQFEREDLDSRRYQEFIEKFLERDWKIVPVDSCQEYLKFPKVLNTKTADTSDHIRHDLKTFYV